MNVEKLHNLANFESLKKSENLDVFELQDGVDVPVFSDIMELAASPNRSLDRTEDAKNPQIDHSPVDSQDATQADLEISDYGFTKNTKEVDTETPVDFVIGSDPITEISPTNVLGSPGIHVVEKTLEEDAVGIAKTRSVLAIENAFMTKTVESHTNTSFEIPQFGKKGAAADYTSLARGPNFHPPIPNLDASRTLKSQALIQEVPTVSRPIEPAAIVGGRQDSIDSSHGAMIAPLEGHAKKVSASEKRLGVPLTTPAALDSPERTVRSNNAQRDIQPAKAEAIGDQPKIGAVRSVPQGEGAFIMAKSVPTSQGSLLAKDETSLNRIDGGQDELGPTQLREAAIKGSPQALQVTLADQGTARSVAQQLLATITSKGAHQSEIHLNPKELGSVRMQIAVQDSVINVTILAERQETTDLMRRHIETLTSEFRQMGYNSISFSFDSQTKSNTADQAEDDELDMTTDIENTPIDLEKRLQPVTDSGLDLRL